MQEKESAKDQEISDLKKQVEEKEKAIEAKEVEVKKKDAKITQKDIHTFDVIKSRDNNSSF